MNYEKHYQQLMLKATKRQEDDPTWATNTYTEKHHWYPKSLYPEYAALSWNLIILTAREHFVAHWLLHKSMPTNNPMAIAFWAMCNGYGDKNRQMKLLIPSRAFQTAREAVSKAMSGANNPGYGKQLSEETRKKISVAQKGKVLSDEHKEKLRIAHTGKVMPEETKAKISAGNKGKVLSEETKKKLSAARSGDDNPNIKFAHIHCSTTNKIIASKVVLNRWSKENNYHQPSLTATARADRAKPSTSKNRLSHKGIYARYI